MRQTTLFLLAFLAFPLTMMSQMRKRPICNVGTEPHTSLQHRVGTKEGAQIFQQGAPHIPVVLVQFNDLKFMHSAVSNGAVHSYFDGFFNGTDNEYLKDGNFGSIKKYFEDQSHGKFSPIFDVYGPVTLSNGYAYYGSDAKGQDYNIKAFYDEATTLAVDLSGKDWMEYGADGSSFIFFLYAGEGQNNSGNKDHIWPKDGVSTIAINTGEQTLRFSGYGCTNELYDGLIDGIGTACHELSHALGLPDLYNTSNENASHGPDYWDLMDMGDYAVDGLHPCGYSAYERDFMGWKSLVEIPYDARMTLTLGDIQGEENVAYKIVNPANRDEYFVLENRQNTSWDEHIGQINPGQKSPHGLLITHIDYAINAWRGNSVNTNNSHLRLKIVPADEEFLFLVSNPTYSKWLQSFLGDTYPGYFNVTEMSDYSVYSGGKMQMRIDNIHEEDGVVTLNLNGGDASSVTDIAKREDIMPAYYDLTGRKVAQPAHGVYVEKRGERSRVVKF